MGSAKGLEVLEKFTTYYEKLGPSGYTVVMHLPPTELFAQDDEQSATNVDVTPWTIQAFPHVIKEIKLNDLITQPYDIILDQWGGALEPSGETALVEAKLSRVQQHVAGISYGDRRLKLLEWIKDPEVGGVIARVFLICSGVQGVK